METKRLHTQAQQAEESLKASWFVSIWVRLDRRIQNELTSLSEKNPQTACLSPAQHLHSSGLTPGDVWATGFLS